MIVVGIAKEKSEVFFFKRGVKCTKSCQFDQAIANYNKALEIEPGYSEAYVKRDVVDR
jgi:hypothetical protein